MSAREADLERAVSELRALVDDHEQRLSSLELAPHVHLLDAEGEDTQPVPLLPKWLLVARGDIGLHEVPGPQSAPRIATAFALVGLPKRDDSAVAWCSAILALWVSEGGLSLRCPATKRTPMGKVTAAARSWLAWGQACEPRIGAVAVLTRGSSDSLGHVGIVTAWDADSLTLVSGNSRNRVTEAKYDRARLLGLRWPA